MKTKQPIFLLSLTFLFLFSGSVYGGDLEDGRDALKRKDYDTAYNLLLPLAEKGNAEAQFELGTLYRKTEEGSKEIVKWYRLAAEQGHASSQYWLATLYFYGLGVLKDYKEALRLYRLSAEQGYSKAQLILGHKYKLGEGVLQDYKKSIKWYRLAAEQGNVTAQRFLGRMYGNGKGIEKDYALAHMWWNLAGSNGDEKAMEYRDIIEKRMSPSQIEEAQRMARNWKPKK
jgi:uncharacterized protein